MASTRSLLTSLVAVLTFASVSINIIHGCGINVVNSCPYEVTTCAQNLDNNINQYNLGSGATQFLDFGSACLWPSGAVWASVTGQCAVSGNPKASTDRNLADLAEFNIGGGSDVYDISNVDAYTIGLGIDVINSAGGECTNIQCVIADIRSFCQGNNVLETLPSGALTCRNIDGPGPVPTPNTRLFKAACPNAYSYSNDSPTSNFNCNTGSNYQVTFCPGGITLPVNQSGMDVDH